MAWDIFKKKNQIKSNEGCDNPLVKNWWYPLGLNAREYYGHNYGRAYEFIANVSIVINKRAECFGNAVPYIVDKKNNEIETSEAKQYRALFSKPNFFQDWQSFYISKEIYKLVYGYSIVYLHRAYEKAIPAQMIVIPNNEISFVWNDKKYFQSSIAECIESVRINGVDTDIDFNDLVIFRDIKQGFGKTPLLAQSRLSALYDEYNLTKSIAEAERTIVDNRGALGILSTDTDAPVNAGMFADEKVEVQRRLKENYGLKKRQNNVIVTSMPLKWQQISMPLKDLMLIELDKAVTEKIAGVYEVPFNLIPGGSDSTFSNQKEAKKALYQESIIPTSNGDATLFTEALGMKSVHLELDYSDLYLFQEDLNEKASTTTKMISGLKIAVESGLLTHDEARTILSEYVDIDPKSKK